MLRRNIGSQDFERKRSALVFVNLQTKICISITVSNIFISVACQRRAPDVSFILAMPHHPVWDDSPHWHAAPTAHTPPPVFRTSNVPTSSRTPLRRRTTPPLPERPPQKCGNCQTRNAETRPKKKPRSKYFNPRSGISTQPGKRKFRRNNFRPSFHKYSETVPTGQSQLQNALRNKNAIATNVTSKNIAAGCSSGTCLVTKKYFRFIMPAMGSQPSTPAGRDT